MLLPNSLHIGRQYASSSNATAASSEVNVILTSGAANTKGNWTLVSVGVGFTESFWDYINIQAVKDSGGSISATTLNTYVDIGIGTSTSAVRVVAENLAAPNSQGYGAVYFLPLMMQRSRNLYARLQCTQASATCGINVVEGEGRRNPLAYNFIKKVVALGLTTGSTTGTAITPANGLGSWTQIVASTAEHYVGIMASPVFNVDTTMTSGLNQVVEVALVVGASERLIAAIGSRNFLWSSTEQKNIVCVPTYVSIPAGSKLSARVNGSAAPDASNSVALYGLIGG